MIFLIPIIASIATITSLSGCNQLEEGDRLDASAPPPPPPPPTPKDTFEKCFPSLKGYRLEIYTPGLKGRYGLDQYRFGKWETIQRKAHTPYDFQIFADCNGSSYGPLLPEALSCGNKQKLIDYGIPKDNHIQGLIFYYDCSMELSVLDWENKVVIDAIFPPHDSNAQSIEGEIIAPWGRRFDFVKIVKESYSISKPN